MACDVTAVDDSDDMLSALPIKARGIRSSIETLSTKPDFDIALLASFIFNKPEKLHRKKLVDSVRRHLKIDGKFLLQIHNEKILIDVDESRTTTVGEITSRISDYVRTGNIVSMTVHYVVGNEEWTHSFQAQFLTLNEIADELIQAGFSEVDWADKVQGWVVAT